MYCYYYYYYYYPHMPIGIVRIYRLLFVCVCVCTVTDFSAYDRGVKFCHGGSSASKAGNHTFWGNLCSPRSPKSDESASARATPALPAGNAGVARALAESNGAGRFVQQAGAACVDRGQSPLTYLLLLHVKLELNRSAVLLSGQSDL